VKILNSIPSLFNILQKRTLENYLKQKVGTGLIQWKSIFKEHFNRRYLQIANGLKLDRVTSNSKADINRISEQFDDIEITLSSLASESDTLNTTIHHHEMFRKDNVKTFFNISKQYVDMVNNEVKDYSTNNVTVENGIIEMIPSTVIDYPIKTVEVTYFPDNHLDRSGNDPTPENIVPGTDNDYWLTEIITQHRSSVGAVVTFGFGGHATFNVLQFSAAGKYAIDIDTIEVLEGDDWVEYDWSGDDCGKFIQVSLIDESDVPVMVSAEFVRVTFIQKKSDYLWEKRIDNEREVLNAEYTGETVTNNYVYNDTFELYQSKTLSNVHSYIFGLYYIRILLKTYNGFLTGNFYSRKFPLKAGSEFITLDTDEYAPSPFTISYKLIQHDGSYATTGNQNNTLSNGERVHLVDTFRDLHTSFGSNSNVIKLQHLPITSGFTCSINGISTRLVEQFDQKNDYQVIISGNILYFNKQIKTSDMVRAYYYYLTDYVIVHAILKINTGYEHTDCPKILKFNVGVS
jgi:hypothetical protein